MAARREAGGVAPPALSLMLERRCSVSDLA